MVGEDSLPGATPSTAATANSSADAQPSLSLTAAHEDPRPLSVDPTPVGSGASRMPPTPAGQTRVSVVGDGGAAGQGPSSTSAGQRPPPPPASAPHKPLSLEEMAAMFNLSENDVRELREMERLNPDGDACLCCQPGAGGFGFFNLQADR
mmetsp:Transcript_27968/g.79101  ORF Transcript_27968/g.79101 Transcript_27968/m.79101 type:complete len:150 (+) Transcript_27968:399-848(+)